MQAAESQAQFHSCKTADGGTTIHSRLAPAGTTVLLFEGNYLLFDETGWRDLAAKWDAAIWLDVPPAILEARLIQRWRDQGMSEADATARARMNDLTNARHVIDKALPAKWTVSN